MTPIDTSVRKARFRITVNRWLNQLCTTVLVAAAAFAVAALAVRLWGWPAPLTVIASAMLAAAVIVSIIWAVATRVDIPEAAAALDAAAGLRERISSSLYCIGADDAFQRAVLADAEQVSGSVTVQQHLRYSWPPRFAMAAIVVMLAAGMPFVPAGLLVRAGEENQEQEVQAERTAAVIKKRTERIKRVARTNAELKKAVDDLDKLGEAPDGRLRTPANQRNLALKKLDQIKDVLKRQRSADRFNQAKEFKKMLRALKPPKQPDSPLSKMAKALAAGDFKSAQQHMREAQKQLASAPADSEQAKTLQSKLAELSKKIEALAGAKKLKQKLAQAGIKKADIERVLKHPSPENMEALKKALEKKGLSQKSIDKLTKELKKRAGANQMANRLAQALQQAASSMAQGQSGQASSAMNAAAGQLSEMEMLEQEMDSLDAMMADVQSAKSDLSKPCSRCNGTGFCKGDKCSACGGSGSGNGGMGSKMGRGRGGLASERRTATSFVKKKQKVYSGQGAIIGKYLIDGEQYKGDISPAAREVLDAAETEATDAIDRAKIPRRYHKAVKGYFSDIRKELARTQGKTTPPTEKPDDE